VVADTQGEQHVNVLRRYHSSSLFTALEGLLLRKDFVTERHWSNMSEESSHEGTRRGDR
jgi:hypothetical protein